MVQAKRKLRIAFLRGKEPPEQFMDDINILNKIDVSLLNEIANAVMDNFPPTNEKADQLLQKLPKGVDKKDFLTAYQMMAYLAIHFSKASLNNEILSGDLKAVGLPIEKVNVILDSWKKYGNFVLSRIFDSTVSTPMIAKASWRLINTLQSNMQDKIGLSSILLQITLVQEGNNIPIVIELSPNSLNGFKQLIDEAHKALVEANEE